MMCLVAMLVQFTFANYSSFRDDTEFSMIASKIRADKEATIPIPGYEHTKLLPVSAIYGGNATGKTNLVRALLSFREMVLSGKLASTPFLLDRESAGHPTSFTLTVLVDGIMWKYHLALLGERVQRETLIRLHPRREGCVIFDRQPAQGLFETDASVYAAEGGNAQEFAQQVGRSLADDKPLLTVCESLNVPGLKHCASVITRWLRDSLVIATADAGRRYIGLDFLKYREAYSRALRAADTGILELTRTPLPLYQCGIPQEQIENFRVSKMDTFIPSSGLDAQLIKENGEVKAYRWTARHADKDSGVPDFPLMLESDGTIRFMHLLPILLEEEHADRVYVVDELDRSMHPNLTRFIIENHLRRVRRGRACQLIFTTHDAMLLDQSLLRRDEFWYTERDEDHVSHLIPFSDFVELRKDKDIRKSYIQGRLGGIPNLRDLVSP